jgi:hypothetical protein
LFETRYLTGALLAPIYLVHTFALGHLLLRPPISTAIKLTAPLVLIAAIVFPLIDISLIRLSAALLVVHFQWLIVRILYQRFVSTYGRLPRNVYFAAAEVSESGPDTRLFIVGSLALIVGPTLILGLAVEVEKWVH